MRFIGYGYQHHHVPDWDPPKGWPWKAVKTGHNGRGVDCSNFTAFVYNQGFGIKPSGDVSVQAKQLQFAGPGEGRQHRVLHLGLPKNYGEFINKLRTGDLLYVRNNSGEVAHVVLWVGPIGQSPDKVPLIIDSHGM
jgi:cell wall-associated NlpC family hydrolase